MKEGELGTLRTIASLTDELQGLRTAGEDGWNSRDETSDGEEVREVSGVLDEGADRRRQDLREW